MDGINWEKVLEAELRRHDGRAQAIGSLRQQIAELEEDYGRLRAAQTDTAPTKTGSSAMEDRLLDNIVARDRLKARLHGTLRRWQRLEKALRELPAEQQTILQRFYIRRPENYRRILCDELCLEQSELYRHKDRAMEELVLRMYGEE